MAKFMVRVLSGSQMGAIVALDKVEAEVQVATGFSEPVTVENGQWVKAEKLVSEEDVEALKAAKPAKTAKAAKTEGKTEK